MKTWWLGLNSREQALVASLGGVLAIFLFISLVWQPLNENIAKSEKKLARQQALLTWVHEQTAHYNANKGQQRGRSSSGSLSNIVNKSAGQKGIKIARMQPQGDQIQVWIDNIEFNQLLAWLAQLSNNENINVTAIDITDSDVSGEVIVRRLQLGRN